jgi:chemotaxis protein MotA
MRARECGNGYRKSLVLLAGVIVVCTVMLMGGDLHMFVSEHAAIVIFGGAFAATLIRFPLTSILHGMPLGMRFACTMRRMSQRELVDELAGLPTSRASRAGRPREGRGR